MYSMSLNFNSVDLRLKIPLSFQLQGKFYLSLVSQTVNTVTSLVTESVSKILDSYRTRGYKKGRVPFHR